MSKTKRKLRREIEQAQILLLVVDARAPVSSFYQDSTFLKKKPVLVMAKTDLADPQRTKDWIRWFRKRDFCIFKSSRMSAGELVRISPKSPVYAVVAGLPNVGKSTLINRLVGRKKARTGALPGLTRGPQWVKLREGFWILDTPGVFYPERLPMEKSWRLAAAGTVPEKAYSSRILEICERLVGYAQEHYGRPGTGSGDFFSFLKSCGEKRGVLSKGGAVNLEETARRLIYAFQKGEWGRMTLELPGEG